jgi:hypothetical protein
MPYGGNDWLGLTQEPAVEPELPICDAHHHILSLLLLGHCVRHDRAS